MPSEPCEYISVKAVAALVGCTPQTISKHTRLKLIPPSITIKVGRRTKYHRVKLMKHLRGGEV